MHRAWKAGVLLLEVEILAALVVLVATGSPSAVVRAATLVAIIATFFLGQSEIFNHVWASLLSVGAYAGVIFSVPVAFSSHVSLTVLSVSCAVTVVCFAAVTAEWAKGWAEFRGEKSPSLWWLWTVSLPGIGTLIGGTALLISRFRSKVVAC